MYRNLYTIILLLGKTNEAEFLFLFVQASRRTMTYISTMKASKRAMTDGVY
jgi:hypothetical protein